MVSQTKINVERKRKIRRKQRRVKFFRLLVVMVIFCLIMTAVGWVCQQAYNWAAKTYAVYAEIYDDYRQRRELRAASFDPRFDGYTNILFVGLDTGAEGMGQQADNMFLLSFRHEDGAVRIVNIPRFTLTEIPGIQGIQRLNSAYPYGGINLLEQSVEKLLNVTVHHNVVIDTEALRELVDVIGGIDVYVETNMDYDDPEDDLHIHIPKGYQHMDGDTAQKYLRYASDDLGAYGRGKRQQSFIKAVYNRMLQPDMVTKLPQLTDVWQRRVHTTIEVFDAGHFASLVSKLANVQPELKLLPGGWDQYGSWVSNPQDVQNMMNELFPQPEEQEENKGFFDFF